MNMRERRAQVHYFGQMELHDTHQFIANPTIFHTDAKKLQKSLTNILFF